MTRTDRAKQFVREVLASEFGQNVDEDTINTVADKVLRSLPTDKTQKKKAGPEGPARSSPGN
jgi:hypothetical protein